MGLLPAQEAYLKTFAGFKPDPQATAKDNAKTLARHYGFEVSSPQYCDVVQALKDISKAHIRQLEREKSGTAKNKKRENKQAAAEKNARNGRKEIANAPQLTRRQLDAALNAWFQSFRDFPVDRFCGWQENLERLVMWQQAKTNVVNTGTTKTSTTTTTKSLPRGTGTKWMTKLPTAGELQWLKTYPGFQPNALATRKANLHGLAKHNLWKRGEPSYSAAVARLQKIDERTANSVIPAKSSTQGPQPILAQEKQSGGNVQPAGSSKKWQKQLPTAEQLTYLSLYPAFKPDPSIIVATNMRRLVAHMG